MQKCFFSIRCLCRVLGSRMEPTEDEKNDDADLFQRKQQQQQHQQRRTENDIGTHETTSSDIVLDYDGRFPS